MTIRPAIKWTGVAAVLLGVLSCNPTETPTPVYVAPTMAPLQTATPTVTPPPTATPTPTPPVTPTPECAAFGGRVEMRTYYSAILGREMSYRIYLPPCYDFYDDSYPVIYLIHGYPFNDSHWDRLGVDEVVGVGISSHLYPPLIIVMPECDTEGIFVNTSGGDYSVEGLFVNELVPHIDSTYRTWAAPEGRAIGGISRGAVWSLEIGFLYPTVFSIVGAHSAALAVNYPHPVYDPLILATDPRVAQLRIYLDAGDVDWARYGVGQLHDVLDEHGIAHEFVIGEGDHADEYWASMLAQYLDFYTASWPLP